MHGGRPIHGGHQREEQEEGGEAGSGQDTDHRAHRPADRVADEEPPLARVDDHHEQEDFFGEAVLPAGREQLTEPYVFVRLFQVGEARGGRHAVHGVVFLRSLCESKVGEGRVLRAVPLRGPVVVPAVLGGPSLDLVDPQALPNAEDRAHEHDGAVPPRSLDHHEVQEERDALGENPRGLEGVEQVQEAGSQRWG